MLILKALKCWMSKLIWPSLTLAKMKLQNLRQRVRPILLHQRTTFTRPSPWSTTQRSYSGPRPLASIARKYSGPARACSVGQRAVQSEWQSAMRSLKTGRRDSVILRTVEASFKSYLSTNCLLKSKAISAQQTPPLSSLVRVSHPVGSPPYLPLLTYSSHKQLGWREKAIRVNQLI